VVPYIPDDRARVHFVILIALSLADTIIALNQSKNRLISGKSDEMVEN
jgi:hypothetical protein